MEKIIIHGIPSLDEETVGRMTKDEWSKYLKFQEVLFQLQIFKNLLSWEMIDKFHSIDHKRTYILSIKECFNNFVYVYRNCVYNLLELFFVCRVVKKETNKIYSIPKIRKIIGPKGIRHIDVHVSSKNRYDKWVYFGTAMGIDDNTKLDFLKRARKECIDEMNNIYRKIIDFSKNILEKIDKEIGKRH